MKSLEDSEELTYEEIQGERNQDFDLLYEEVHRKVESQVELNKRIEGHARSRVKSILILAGVLISSLSLVTSVIASNEGGIAATVSASLNNLYYILLDTGFIGEIQASILTGLLLVFCAGSFGTVFAQLFVGSLYYNLSAARTSLVSSSATTGRLQDSIHDNSNMKRPKKCILYDYADTIALNNRILEKKWVDKETGDELMIRAFVNSFLLLMIITLTFVIQSAMLLVVVVAMTAVYAIYRIFRLCGYIESASIFNLIDRFAS